MHDDETTDADQDQETKPMASKGRSNSTNKWVRPRGSASNAIITRRNGGVTHQFLNDIGGCSANYR